MMLAARRQASLEGCTQDAMHAINQQREQRPADRLLIVGSSWGGAVAVDCVAKGVQPDAMLLLAPALAASGLYGLFWPRASLPNTLFDAMRDKSVVCLHGTDDDVVRVSEGRCRDHRRGVPTQPPLLTKHAHPPHRPPLHQPQVPVHSSRELAAKFPRAVRLVEIAGGDHRLNVALQIGRDPAVSREGGCIEGGAEKHLTLKEHILQILEHSSAQARPNE